MTSAYHAASPAAEVASKLPAKVVLATHYLSSGAPLSLEDYLRPRTDQFLFIAHPLIAGKGVSYFRRFSNGVLVESADRSGPRGPGRFVEEVVQTIRWTARRQGLFEVFIAANSLLALAGLWLRWRRRVRSVILYSIDYVPRRFSNPVLNRIYHGIDAFTVRRVEAVWNVSEAIGLARRQRDGAAPDTPQIVVPVGADYERIHRRTLAEADPHRIAFIGNLMEQQGLQVAIEALPKIRAAVPDATLLVIGSGAYLAELQAKAQRCGVDDAVEFAGFIEDHTEIEERLARSALAVAPYVPDPKSFTRFADPMKIKTYLACGLPVVMTDVPSIASTVEASGAGRIVPYSADALAAAVVDYLADPQGLDRARTAAGEFAANFAWDRIFDEAWTKTMPLLQARPRVLSSSTTRA